VAIGTLLVGALIDGVDWWAAALVAAILAPRDVALGQEVVTDPSVPARIRQGLNIESGLNDGMVVPAVALFLTLAVDENDAGSARFSVTFVFEQVGVAMGAVVGAGGAWLLGRAAGADWADGIYVQLATLAVAVGAFTTSLSLNGNGFIVAFVGDLAFGRVSADSSLMGEYTENTSQLAAAISFFLFGNVLLGPALGDVTVSIVLCAVLVLTVDRMVPVAIAMIGSGAATPTVAFLGWFGPRGLASILFGLLLLEEDLSAGADLFAIVAWTVILSVVLHGSTAARGARTYGAWWAAMDHEEQQTMPEGVAVAEHRVRRA